MPFEQISEVLNDYEKMDCNEEKEFIASTAKKYEQSEDAVLRRLVEVRKLVDYNMCTM